MMPSYSSQLARVLVIHGAVLGRAPLSPSASLGFARPSGRSLVAPGIRPPMPGVTRTTPEIARNSSYT